MKTTLLKNMWRPLAYTSMAMMALLSASGEATLTPINAPGGSEPNLVVNSAQQSVLNHLYGAGNYVRVDDSLDQIWNSTNGTTQVVARFAGNNQTLGYYKGSSGLTDGTTFNTLYNVGGSGYGVTGASAGLTEPNFRWGLKTVGSQGTQYLSSKPSDNVLDDAAYKDHMVTFKITGTSGGHSGNVIGNYILAFEDLLYNHYKGYTSDRDFQDAVFEFKKIGVPEPSTYLILGTTLFAAMVLLWRRKQAKARI